MKRFQLFVIIILNLFIYVKGENKTNYKTVKYINEMEIRENKEFIFIKPKKILVDKNGEIFVMGKKQILRFSPEGKYLGNLFKYGQGPGELLNLENFVIYHDTIFVNQFIPHKIVCFKTNGRFIKEFKAEKTMQKLLFCNSKKCIMLKYEIPFNKIKKTISSLDVNWKMYEVLFDGKIIEDNVAFSSKWIIIKGERGVGANEIEKIRYTMYRDNYLYISSRSKYLINIFSINSKKIIKRIKKQYVSIKKEQDKTNENTGFKKLYYDDIQKMIILNNQLWVFTSKVDKEKGILIDKYSLSGKYIESAFLKINGINSTENLTNTIFTVKNNFLYILLNTDEENIRIKKIKVL